MPFPGSRAPGLPPRNPQHHQQHHRILREALLHQGRQLLGLSPPPMPGAEDTEDRSCSARGCEPQGKSQNPPTPDPVVRSQTQHHNWPQKEKQ